MKLFHSINTFVATLLCVCTLVFSTGAYAGKLSESVENIEQASIMQPVNINTADAATLALAIKGIGEKKAEAIIAYRTAHGDFTAVDDLLLVKGIGEKTVEKNRSSLSVN